MSREIHQTPGGLQMLNGKTFLTITAATLLLTGFGRTIHAEIVYEGLDDDLVSYWSFDEGSGTDAFDKASAPTDDGTLDGSVIPVWNCDPSEAAPAGGNSCSLEFDTTTDNHVRVPDSDRFDLGTVAAPEFTVSAWIYPETATSPYKEGYQYIVAKDGVSYSDRSFIFYLQQDAKLAFSIIGGGSAINAASLTLDTWHHVAGTYKYVSDGTSEIRIYVDGIEVAAKTDAGGPAITGDADVTIGRSDLRTIGGLDPALYDRTFDGLIDEVRIYDVVLSEEEIGVLATPFLVSKLLDEATELDGNADTAVDLNENWQWNLLVDITQFDGPGELSDLYAKDPLPGDIELGDGTSGESDACSADWLLPSEGAVSTKEKGRTDKCFAYWDIPGLFDGEADLVIIASTDKNPQKKQEYTSAKERYCLNKLVTLTGTIGVDETEVEFETKSNGVEVAASDVSITDSICDGIEN